MEGAYPSGVLIGTDGAFYGTTSSGGTNLTFSGGTVFKLNGDGTGFRLLHSFGGTLNDGAYPQSLLLLAKDDILYGTAGSGNIFRLKTDGTDFLVVHNFPHDLQLGVPQTLVQGEDGSLYGLTGQVQAPGSAFRINPDGAEYTVLHIFGSDLHDGRTPKGPLLQGSDGAFYGATSFGGAAFQGTVFRMTVSSSLPPPFVLAVIPSADGSFHIQFDGVVGYNYQLETSTNLADWSSVGTVSNETGQVQFLDANQSKAARKFYRVGIAQ
jgi:uncharacterized repeat protein (TIGR03803 family)